MQGNRHDFGREAEGILYTCGGKLTVWTNTVFKCVFNFVRVCTVSMMKVNVDVKDSLLFLSQFEDSQNSVVHVTEPWRLVPVEQDYTSFEYNYDWDIIKK